MATTIMFEEQKATKFNVDLQCGDCLHYKGSANPKFEAPCIKRGVGTKSVAPSCYTPDVSVFRSMSKDAFPMLASLVSLMTPKQSRVLMGVLKYAGSLESAGLQFLEQCYFCHKPADSAYLEDYSKGYALTMTKSGQVVLVGNDFLNNSPAAMVAYISKSSIIQEAAFLKRVERCIDLGRIHNPKTAKRISAGVDYVVPTIDDAPQPPKTKGKKGGTRKTDKDYVYKDGDYAM